MAGFFGLDVETCPIAKPGHFLITGYNHEKIMTQEDSRITQERLDKLAWLLDDAILIPGTGYRIGFDGLIGLIPGVGDALGAALSSFILAQAARLGVPRSTLILMGFNIAIDTVIGAIPFLGDLFDFAWKANRRNVKLLSAYIDNPRKTATSNRLTVLVIFAVLIILVMGVIVLATLLISAIWQAITG